MPQYSSRNAEREARLKTGAASRSDESLLDQVTQPTAAVPKRTTFEGGLTDLVSGEMTPLSVTPTASVKPAYAQPFAQMMGTAEGILPRYADAFGAMAMRVETGVPLSQAMREMAALLPLREGSALREAAAALENGTPISSAVRAQGRALHPILAPILEVSEQAGRTEGALRNCETAFRRLQTAERKLDFTVLHPVVRKGMNLNIGLAFALVNLLRFVLPELLPLFLAAAGGVGIGGLLLRQTLLSRNPARWGRFLIQAPGRGAVERDTASAAWLRSFAVLWGAGVPISAALETSAELAGNPHYAWMLQTAAEQTRHGKSLSSTLETTKLLPSRLTDFVKTAELTGDLDGLLNAHADYLTDEAKQSAAQWFGLIALVLYALNAAVILYKLGSVLGCPQALLRLMTLTFTGGTTALIYWLWIGALNRKRQ